MNEITRNNVQVIEKFYQKTGNRIKCLLCSHYCQLIEGQTGVCGVNKNENGRLVNLVYGKIAAFNIDPIEKKPLYHFLPGSTALSIGTVGCNMQCSFCQNWQISQVRKVKKQEIITPVQLVQLARKYNSKSIAYTYNEPTIFYPYARDVALEAKKYGIKNIFVTNGIESKEVIDDMKGIIDAANVDLKSFDANYYKKELKAPFTVIDTLKQMKKNNIWVEVTTLIIPGINDEPAHLSQIASFIARELGTDTPWHISAFHPDYKMRDKSATPRQTLEKAYDIGTKQGLHYIYIGNLGLPNVTKCPVCKSSLIERRGYQIIFNKMTDGKCYHCKTKIPGIWN